MPHIPPLVLALAVGLGLAFALGYVAARLRLPPLIGYLAAGWLVGPFGPLTGARADVTLAADLAEIGVILLMFGVGVHFSVADLLAVRRDAVPGALAGMLVTGLLGTGLGLLLGWDATNAAMFGLAVCISSTVVVMRTFEQRDALDDVEGRLAVGWMVVEDLAMVLALVLLPALAPSLGGNEAAASGAPLTPTALAAAIAVTLGKVGAFVAIMWFVGRRAMPLLLWSVARTGSRELFTLVVLAAALGVAVGATAFFGISVALGAFCAGLVISESDLSHQAAADALPLQDAFAVLFFISVGMLFDPRAVLEQPVAIGVLVLLVLTVKPCVATFLLLRSGHAPRVATAVGASLGEIGEFSFILAGLGVSLGLMDTGPQQLVLAAAILTISLNPLLDRPAHRLAEWLVTHDRFQGGFELRATEHQEPATAGSATRSFVAALDRHAIIVGYGRVGSTIADALQRAGTRYVVIEQNVRVVEALRAQGVTVIVGNAARPPVLALAAPERARLLIVTAPDPFAARRIIEVARATNPRIDTVVRTHSAAEQAYLEAINVGRAVMGERELAFGMAHYAIKASGREEEIADRIVSSLRDEGREERGATREYAAVVAARERTVAASARVDSGGAPDAGRSP